MAWSYKHSEQGRLMAGDIKLLENLNDLDASAIKEKFGSVCVVDLRKEMHIEKQKELTAKYKEQGVQYVHVPVTFDTASEQDLDTFRRECARNWSDLRVVSLDGSDACYFAAAHVFRKQGWTSQRCESEIPELARSQWLPVLESYLTRHVRS